MKLTKTVEEGLRSAQARLRETLAFAARTEEPIVAKHIADMSLRIDALIDVSELVKSLDSDD